MVESSLLISEDVESRMARFRQIINLNARLPEQVFLNRAASKFVISESGYFHRKEIFERLAKEYGDISLSNLVLAPLYDESFGYPGNMLSYSIRITSNFDEAWRNATFGMGQAENEQNKIWPWMSAEIQCYVGSTGHWCSYHENMLFEVDIFCVPEQCDVLNVFGESSWQFDDFQMIIANHALRVSANEALVFKKNYF
ncbi:MAG: hypothetical protein LCH46_00665 [Proteobacteria bacterium]|nr:hypothetical protein [Pseudomonadota bacterium]